MGHSWFPSGRNDQTGWRLDIVSLLAVIGESLVADHVQRLTSSWLCLLPRLIPAPQAMLRSDRPKRMPSVSGVTVVGAFSNTKVDELNFVANLVHNVGELKPQEFQEFEITYNFDDLGRTPTRIEEDLEKNHGRASHTRFTDKRDNLRNMQGRHEKKARLRPRTFSPINCLTLASCLATIGLFVWSLLITDGIAALSIACMSLASVLTGVAFFWYPKLATRPSNASVPQGDLVLKTRSGAFVVIHCHEDIARELYTGADIVEYYAPQMLARVLVGFGTLFLMVGVVLLGNCNWTMQAAIGVTYLLLNGLYWLVSLLPQRWAWHTAAYRVTPLNEFLPVHMRNAHQKAWMNDKFEPPSYTRTLWYAIHRSKATKWIESADAAPMTDAWEEWLQEAKDNINKEDWPAVKRKNEIMEKHSRPENKT